MDFEYFSHIESNILPPTQDDKHSFDILEENLLHNKLIPFNFG